MCIHTPTTEGISHKLPPTHSFREFLHFEHKNKPPPRNFHYYFVHPPYPLEKVVFERKYVKVYVHEHMDKIDSILVSWTKFLTQSREWPILQQNYIQMDRDFWKVPVNRSNSPSHLRNFPSLSPPPSPPPLLHFPSRILSMYGIWIFSGTVPLETRWGIFIQSLLNWLWCFFNQAVRFFVFPSPCIVKLCSQLQIKHVLTPMLLLLCCKRTGSCF